MKWSRWIAAALFVTTAIGLCHSPAQSASTDAKLGAETYRRCAVCHLPDGTGVELAFPPLRERLGAIASTPDGRRYLILTILKGLVGAIEIDGATYRGAMPAEQLDDAQCAAALNYVVEVLNRGTRSANWQPFVAQEIERVREEISSISQRDVLELRSTLSWGDGH